MNIDWIELIVTPLIEGLIPVILDALFKLIGLIALIIATAGINWWKNIAIDNWIKRIVEEAVLSTQEQLWNEEGVTKFVVAKDYVLTRLNKGLSKVFIRISEEEIDNRIDAMVKVLREELIETWYADK